MTTSYHKAEATRFILQLAKELEAAWDNADCEIEVTKELIMEQGKGRNGANFFRMQRLQWLDTECSKSIRDMNALSDLLGELWSEEDFEPSVDYIDEAKRIVDRPASRCATEVKKRSSYTEMKSLVEKISTANTKQIMEKPGLKRAPTRHTDYKEMNSLFENIRVAHAA
jgi:hypothetical protein